MLSKKDIRRHFRDEVFKRDSYICKVCGRKGTELDLDAHHITDRSEMPNGGYVASNGITVCKGECHQSVEQYHISQGDWWEDGLHPDDLYKMIGSSKNKAIVDSGML